MFPSAERGELESMLSEVVSKGPDPSGLQSMALGRGSLV